MLNVPKRLNVPERKRTDVDVPTDAKGKSETQPKRTDANLVITWSRNPHAKTPIPRKPSKSGLIGV